jgi:hypothetical protein
MSTAPTQEPSTQERLEWMSKNSKKLIISLVVIVVAALVVMFSFSIFNSTSANPGNLTTSGIMEQSNSADGQAILTVEKLLPGQSGEGTVTIENVGDADGDFTLTASNRVDEPATPALSDVLTLVVTDGTTEVYNGPMSGIATVALGTWSAGESHTFTFTVTFSTDAGNEYQDARTTVDFTWNAVQSTS